MTAVASAIDRHPAIQRALAIIGSRSARIVLTVLLVAFGLSQIPLGDVLARLEGASLPLVVAGVVLLFAGQVLSGQRWRELAASLDLHESPRFFVTAYLRGCFYNSVLPTGIGGDAMRVALARPLGTWRSATRSVVIDRFTGLAALALAAGALLPVAGLGLPSSITLPVFVVSIALIGAAVVLSSQRGLARWLGWTLAYEIVWFTGVWSLARALGVDLAWATPAVVLVVGLAMALPISFGGHGAREAGFVLALAPLGFGADVAIALGVLFGGALAIVGLAGAFVRVPPARRPASSVPPAEAPPAPALAALHIGARS